MKIARRSFKKGGSRPFNITLHIYITNNRKIVGIFNGIREKVWQIIKKKAIKVLVAMLTAAITALTTTSCMGHSLISF